MTGPDLESADAAIQQHHTTDDVVTLAPGTTTTTHDHNIKLHNDDDNSPNISDDNRGHLSGKEIWNIIFCFLAWACNVSIVTLGRLFVVIPDL